MRRLGFQESRLTYAAINGATQTTMSAMSGQGSDLRLEPSAGLADVVDDIEDQGQEREQEPLQRVSAMHVDI